MFQAEFAIPGKNKLLESHIKAALVYVVVIDKSRNWSLLINKCEERKQHEQLINNRINHRVNHLLINNMNSNI